MAKTGPLFWLFVLVLLGTEGGSSATGGLGHTARPTPPGQGQGGRGGVNGNDLKYPKDNGGFGLQEEHLAIGEGGTGGWEAVDLGFGHQKVEQNDPPGPGAGSDVEVGSITRDLHFFHVYILDLDLVIRIRQITPACSCLILVISKHHCYCPVLLMRTIFTKKANLHHS